MTRDRIDETGTPDAAASEIADGDENPVADAIAAAEEIPDPLGGLIERVAEDPGAPFVPEVLERLSAMKREDRAAFELLRAKLKKAGCHVTALDEAIVQKNGDGGRQPPQADILIDLAGTAELFHTADGTAFADLDINGHRETWPVRTKGFKRWLARQFYETTDGAPSSEALQSALNVVEAKAHFDAPQRPVCIRVGGIDGSLYLDLGDKAWRAVEITTTGWRVVENPPVRFRRAAGMQPLPVPVQGGSVEVLRSFLNVQSDTDFVLVVAWALAVLRNRGPYPVIVLSGEQGSAKSTFSAILRSLLDPNTAPLRALPREDRDLFIAANNGHVLAFDNVSGLPAWISDTLCRLATGGGFAVRQLYTDQDEVLFDAARPVILNGIEDIVTRPDLADRAVFLTLEAIPEERRRSEAELWVAFDAERPRILGVLLDAVVQGLKMLPDTTLERLPRMADFALWASACETAIWPAGTFWSAYCGNRDEAVENVIEADPVAAAVRAVMEERTEWTGTATDLLGALAKAAGERVAKSKTWPASPRALSGRLRRAATFLRKIGIEIDYIKEGRARTRIIHIKAGGNSEGPDYRGPQPSAPSTSSAIPPNGNGANALGDTTMQTVGGVADDRADAGQDGVASTVRPNTLKFKGKDGADATDAKPPSQSGLEKNGLRGLEGDAMTAVGALRAAGAAGVEVALDGKDLVLEASSLPPEPVLDALSKNKARIAALLRPGGDGWSADDWHVHFDERAGIAEFDGFLPRLEAEARGLACCVSEWMNRRPQTSSPDRCLACHGGNSANDPLLPFGTDSCGHAWLHSRCWPGWYEARKDEATSTLVAMGIESPTDFPNDFGKTG